MPRAFFRTVQFNLDAVHEVETISSFWKTSWILCTGAALRANSTAPIAVGFGVRGRAEIEALRHVGADAVVVGSAAVARVERAETERRDVVADLARFVDTLRGDNSAPAPKGVVER